MSRPLISAVMSAWNEERYVADTVESILNQTFTDLEFIIIDDGSTDKTLDILKYFASRDKRVKILVNEANIGIARSLNSGILSAQGEYIAIIDAADTAYPDRFEKQLHFFQDNQNIFIVGTYAYWVDERRNIIGEWDVPTVVENSQLFMYQIAIHPSIMIRKELFNKIGPYRVNSDISVELDLYLRASRYHLGIANIPEFLTDVMLRDKGVTYTNLRTIQLNQFKIKIAYLPHFLSFWNVVCTLRSLFGLLLPSFLLKKLVLKSVRTMP